MHQPDRRLETTVGSKLHLLIIELDYHAEVLSSLCPMLQRRFDITLLTTKKIWGKTHLDKQNQIQVVLKQDRESLSSFFSRTENLWRRADVAYFNTLEKHYKFFSRFDLGMPTMVRVHNVNATFYPWSNLDLASMTSGRQLWCMLREAVATRFKNRMLRKVDCLMMPSYGVKSFYKKTGRLAHQEKIAEFCLPFTLPSSPSQFERDGHRGQRVTIAVTGTVDPARKNYSELYEALVQVKQRTKTQIDLHFLGAPKGRRGDQVIELFRRLEDENFQFHYSRGYVEQTDIDAIMRSVCFLVAPIVMQTRFRVYREYYGKTKVSGVENDIIKFGVPALLPSDYQLGKVLSEGCGFYSRESGLAETIIDWVESSVYVEKRQILSRALDQQGALDQFEELCQGLIKRRNSS